VGIFDFTGTGISPENDADPSNYEIDVGALDVSAIPSGTPVKVRGFVNRFGQAPEDFDAWTVVNVSSARAHLVVNWVPASAVAFDSLSAENLTLNLEGVGLFHHLDRAGVVIDLTELLNPPSIQPPEGGDGLFVISEEGTFQVYLAFENFVAGLEDRLAAEGTVKGIFASGHFDDSTTTLTARYIIVRM